MNENEKNTPFLTTFFEIFKNVVTSADGHEKVSQNVRKKIFGNFSGKSFFDIFLVFFGVFGQF